MNERLIARMLAPVSRAIGNMAARGTVALVNAASKMQSLQLRLLSDEVKDGVEHFEPYGFTANPHSGAEAVTLFFGGDRSHGVALVVGDRRYRLTGLQPGEVALYDDLGQSVHLTRDGMVIDGAGLPILIHNTPSVTMDTTQVNMTGNLHVTGSIVAEVDISDHTDKTMAGMRGTYNSHTHTDPQGGSVSTPSGAM